MSAGRVTDLTSCVRFGPEKKYAVFPAATERVEPEGLSSQEPIGPSRVYEAMESRVRISNQRICLSSQAVIRTLGLLPQMIDLMVLLCAPAPISKPGADVVLPFVRKVGLVGDEESLLGEEPEWERS